MAIANYFYNSTTRKYVALFGTYFNQLTIERQNLQGAPIQRMVVPISYAPFQKILARLEQDPEFANKSGVTLPRMSFEMTSMAYDPDRKISPNMKIRKAVKDESSGNRNWIYAGTPYNLEFSLYIMAKYNEDAVKLLEQILPFFNPEFTSTVRLIDGIEPIDVPLILNSVDTEEIYEGDFTERKSILYTLNFTMRAWFFGPERKKGVIKFIDVREWTSMDPPESKGPDGQITIQPGMTDQGAPTTILGDTVDYSLIDFDDNWDYVVTIDDGS